MIIEVFFALLFILSALLETSLVHSLTFPLAAIPLHFIIGIIIFHRSGVYTGAAWFILSAFVLPILGFDAFFWWSYILVAAGGVALILRVFTNRSVYALVGLGLTLYVLFAIVNVLPVILGFTEPIDPHYVRHRLYGTLFLTIGLYIGFLAAKYVEYLARDVFYIRTKYDVS